ncbi:mitochondrial import inner membrane translocase subunit tim54 [Chytriomyces hyalinus]|nr:mitochondrial import inner membrane translocase subunit tim54 [Chytriomyces hyalinus]
MRTFPATALKHTWTARHGSALRWTAIRGNAGTAATGESNGPTKNTDSKDTNKEKTGWAAWVPSRGWQIFWGITGSIITLALYDNRALSNTQDRFCTYAKNTFASTPSGILERPRRVIVCLPPGDWGKQWFELYVKPILDAAAVDYHIVHPSQPGHLRARVRDYIWKGKTQDPLLPPPAPPAFNWLDSSTWFVSRAGESPEDFVLRSSRRLLQEFHPQDGLVCIGPEAYRETLQGLNYGVIHVPHTRPDERYVLHPHGTDQPTIEAYKAEVAAAKVEYEKNWLYPPTELRVEEASIDQVSVPAVGYVPARNQVGWVGFPKRIWGWFNRRYTAAEVGDAVLRVLKSEDSHKFNEETDYALGKEDAKDFEVREPGTEYECGGWDLKEWPVWKGMDKRVAERVLVH